MPDKTILNTKQHRTIKARFNQWRSRGNVDNGHADLLNELERPRPQARYAMTPVGIAPQRQQELLRAAEEMLASVKASAPRRRAD